MNLIFIYGAPATGKLTVAEELAKATGYKVFKNHTFVSCIADVFPFADKSFDELRSNLTRRLRLEVLKEAARAGVDTITTFGMSGSRYFDFFNELKSEIEGLEGKIFFVQLVASKDALMHRVEEESRKGNKIDSKEFLNDLLAKHPDVFDKFPGVEHLTVENTNLSPEDGAQKILGYYSLQT